MVPPRLLTSRCDCISAMTGAGAVGLELGAVGLRHAADVAGELDDGDLEAEADAEERQFVLPGPADRLDHALDAALAEAARESAARRYSGEQPAGGRLVGEAIAGDPLDVDPGVVAGCRRGSAPPAPTCRRRAGRCTCRPPRCAPGWSGCRIRSVIAFQAREIGLLGLEPEPLAHLAVEALLEEAERDLVDRLARRGSRSRSRSPRCRRARSCA